MCGSLVQPVARKGEDLGEGHGFGAGGTGLTAEQPYLSEILVVLLDVAHPVGDTERSARTASGSFVYIRMRPLTTKYILELGSSSYSFRCNLASTSNTVSPMEKCSVCRKKVR